MRRSRAFTLLEIMLVMLLMGLVGGMGVFAFRRATRSGEARGVTELVAEELRGARNRALSQRIPVAVVMPSAGGTQGQAQSLYILEGETKPHVTRRVVYSREYPQSQLFVGLWPVAGSAGRDDIQTGANGQEFTVNHWQVPVPTDYVLMFTPAGTVKSNGWPHFDGHYHLVVSEGVVAAPTGPPTGSGVSTVNYFALSQVGLPSTITISPAGGVSVQKGLTGLTSGVAVRDHALTATAGGVLPPLWTAAGNQDPVVSSARLDPPQIPPFKIHPNEKTALVLEATDPDGDPLYVNWTTVPANTGRFSLASQSKMDWAPGSPGRWRSCWVWTPPEGWAAGSTCQLRYQVSDGQGGSSTGLIAGDCTSVPPTRLVFAQTTAHGDYEIVTAAPDGKSATFASVEGDQYSHFFPSFSPNGQLIASTGWDQMSLPQRALFVSKADGSQITKIFQSSNNLGDSRPSWSSDGTVLVHSINNYNNNARIWRINVDGSNPMELAVPPAGTWNLTPRCSPRPVAGEDKVLFWRVESTSPSLSHVYTTNLSGVGAPTRITPADGQYYVYPAWSRDATKIAYSSDTNLYVAASDGSSRTPIVTGNLPYFAAFSPNGDKVAYMSYGNGKVYVVTSTGAHVDTAVPNSPKLLASGVAPDESCFWWSPDGEQICWQDYNRLHTVNVLGPVVDRTFLQPTGATNRLPCWWGP